ncbi:MAG: hypothetical protein HQL40_09670 [Alphaproteobacteria bacterium]|nr:hypothetical protein [Alphaproteobacteria bacterium]MBF0333896.1 hypothetical protein [Alphaproteobacteria bacterium]
MTGLGWVAGGLVLLVACAPLPPPDNKIERPEQVVPGPYPEAGPDLAVVPGHEKPAD